MDAQRLRSTCIALFVLDVAYCALAVVEPRLPGWHMFESVDRLDITIRDRNGEVVDLRHYVPKNAYLTARDEALAVAKFVCQRHPERAPFRLEDPSRGQAVAFGPGNCEIHEGR